MRSIRGLYVIRSGGAVSSLLPSRIEPVTRDDAEPGDMPVMVVDFSRFGTWYEIDSFWEGRFLEQVKRGAFKRTIEQRGDQVKVLFNHGFDFNIGDKILGVPEVLEERPTSPHMEVPLLDTSYNRDLVPGLRAGGYGSSFMFEVLNESWEHEPDKSDHNPDGLPERTITEVRLFEAGPVTWPANPEATAGLRSGTDWLVDELARRDADRRGELVAHLDAFRAQHKLRTPSVDGSATLPAPTPQTPAPGDEPARHVEGTSRSARERVLALNANRRGGRREQAEDHRVSP